MGPYVATSHTSPSADTTPGMAEAANGEDAERKRVECRPFTASCDRCSAVALRWAAAAVAVAALWTAAAAAMGSPFLPGGGAFSAVALAVVAGACSAMARVTGLPPLLGPLVAGVLLRSVGVVKPDVRWQHAAAIGRKSALAVILLRAGLGLDGSALRRLSTIVVRMTVLPSLVEALVLTVASNLLLGLPWLWGAMAGAMMAAVSPAVVIPALFRLQEKGFGTDKGITTLVVAAASFDDVIAVTAFGVLHSLVFSHGEGIWDGVQRGLLALPMGLIFGVIWGFMARLLPTNTDSHAAGLRAWLLLGGALLGVLGGDVMGYDAAGPLAAIVAAFVAAHAWRTNTWNGRACVEGHFRTAWVAFEVMLFALIGVEVDVTALRPIDVALCGGALILALAVRIAATVAIAFGGGFSWKEKLFLAFAWFPKATVQAALGPVALDSVRHFSLGAEAEAFAGYLLTMAAFAILITAPLGAALLHGLGPRLLRTKTPPTPPSNVEQESELKSGDRRGENNSAPVEGIISSNDGQNTEDSEGATGNNVKASHNSLSGSSAEERNDTNVKENGISSKNKNKEFCEDGDMISRL